MTKQNKMVLTIFPIYSINMIQPAARKWQALLVQMRNDANRHRFGPFDPNTEGDLEIGFEEMEAFVDEGFYDGVEYSGERISETKAGWLRGGLAWFKYQIFDELLGYID